MTITTVPSRLARVRRARRRSGPSAARPIPAPPPIGLLATLNSAAAEPSAERRSLLVERVHAGQSPRIGAGSRLLL